MTPSADDPTSTCLAWGPLKGKKTEHASCPVVVTVATQVEETRRAKLGKLPALCGCECLACQRAWWDMGRPMRKGTRIVTMEGKVIAEGRRSARRHA